MTQLPDTTTEAGQHEASVMLARLMGIYLQLFSDMAKFRLRGDDVFVSVYPHGWYHGMTEDEAWKYFPNLYDPANMALAWRVLSFAIDNFSIPNHHFALRAMVNDMAFFTMPIAAAQRAWLDKILTLAIEAGMIEE